MYQMLELIKVFVFRMIVVEGREKCHLTDLEREKLNAFWDLSIF